MQNSHKALWDNCLHLISQNVTKQIFKTWFEPIVFESYDEEEKTVLVQVPSPYIYEYLEQYYVRLMAWALQNSFKANVRLKYRLVTDKENKKNQEWESDAPSDIEAPRPTTRGNKSPTVLDAAVPQNLNPQLDPKKTFDNYIEGNSNKLPRTVGLSIAEHPGKSTFNPFFIYGPSGCGKTHLINAIGVQCKRMYPQKRVLYVSARLFQVQFTDSVRQNTTNDFINFYQTIDVLIVDDIQEWVNSPKTLDTFFHIFDHLFRLGKQIILASDRPPVDLVGVKDRLLTIQFVAQTANGSVRDLEGVLNSLMAYSIVYNSNIDMHLAERVIKRAVKVDNHPLTIDDILEKVCQHFGVSQQHVISKSRKRDYVQVRQVSMYLAQKYTKMPASRIGQLIGGRDHSTVIHSCSTIEQRLKVDKAFVEELNSIEHSFKLKS